MSQVRSRDVDPQWISNPFAPAHIYQGGEQPAYFPDANQFMPQQRSFEPEADGGESAPPKEDTTWRQVEQDASYPTAPFARARIYVPENNHESYYPNTLDSRSQADHREGETESDSESDEGEAPKEDNSWRQVEQDSSYPTKPFSRARI